MTIWEMERKSGLERSNIRFYEKEGLLNPNRRENGYREYTEENLQELLRIKLMRRLGFSIDSIRALQNGSVVMEQALAQRLGAIDYERRVLSATEQVCVQMRQEGAQFATLDAARYLNSFDRALNTSGTPAMRPTVPAGDTVKPPRIPWRRYFARMLDLQIAELIVYAFLLLVCKVNFSHIPSIVDWLLGILGWLVLLPLEALCLSRWRTTPGKALMGITITDADERPLTFGRALQRTWDVFFRGVGLTIPIYGLVRMWKSYKSVRDLEELEWDAYLTVTAKEYKHWRTAVLPVVSIALAGVLLLFTQMPWMPDNRGDDLTVAEFVENYNRLAKFHDLDGAGELQEDGTFLTQSLIYINGMPSTELNRECSLRFETEGDTLVGLTYSRTGGSFLAGYADGEGKDVLRLAAMSLAWADSGLFQALDTTDTLNEFTDHSEGRMEREVLGWSLVYEISPAPENATDWEYDYTAEFTMTRLAGDS